MAEADQVVLYEASDGVARITLNRPAKRNALNDELISGLKALLRRAHDDHEIRVIVLTGAGSDFRSGADLAALQKISTASVEENLEDAFGLMELFSLMRSHAATRNRCGEGKSARRRLWFGFSLRHRSGGAFQSLWLSRGENRFRAGDGDGDLAA